MRERTETHEPKNMLPPFNEICEFFCQSLLYLRRVTHYAAPPEIAINATPSRAEPTVFFEFIDEPLQKWGPIFLDMRRSFSGLHKTLPVPLFGIRAESYHVMVFRLIVKVIWGVSLGEIGPDNCDADIENISYLEMFGWDDYCSFAQLRASTIKDKNVTADDLWAAVIWYFEKLHLDYNLVCALLRDESTRAERLSLLDLTGPQKKPRGGRRPSKQVAKMLVAAKKLSSNDLQKHFGIGATYARVLRYRAKDNGVES